MISPFKKIAVIGRGQAGSKQSLLGGDDVLGVEYGAGSRNTGYLKKTTSLTYKQMWSMYLYNTWVRAIVDRIATKVADIRPIVRGFRKKDKPARLTNHQRKQKEELEEIFKNPNSADESWVSQTIQRMTDIGIYGGHGLELVRDVIDGKVVEVYPVTGCEIVPNVNKKGIFKDEERAYFQKQDGKIVASWPRNNFIWLKANPVAGRIFPTSALETLKQTVTGELYSAQHNLDFFANNATPRLAIMFDNLGMGQANPTLKRMKQWWDKELRGQPHRPIFLGTENGQVKIQETSLTNKEMEFQFYSGWLLTKMMAVYKMQPFVLGVDMSSQAGKLNSAQQVEQFKQDAVKPQLELFADSWNTKVVWSAFGYKTLFLDYANFDIWDRTERAILHERYLRNGVYTINMVLDELGLEAVPWGDTPLIASNLQTMGDLLTVPDAGGESTVPETPEADSNNPEVPGSDSSRADRESDARRKAASWILQSQVFLEGCGFSRSQIKHAMGQMAGRRESYLNKIISFPSKMA